jgi:antitoxin component of MazEF toxin-antitoxin module
MEITKVSQAHSRYKGVKTSIPATYARELEIEQGDEITWELDKDKKGKFLIVRKASK